jgi:hypothetical protein
MAAESLQALLVNEVEARRMLGGLSVKSMFLLRRDRGLPFVKLGSRTLYSPADLAAWIESRKTAGREAKR